MDLGQTAGSGPGHPHGASNPAVGKETQDRAFEENPADQSDLPFDESWTRGGRAANAGQGIHGKTSRRTWRSGRSGLFSDSDRAISETTRRRREKDGRIRRREGRRRAAIGKRNGGAPPE